MTYLSSKQVAEMKGVSVRKIHRMATDGRLKAAEKLPFYKGAYLFTPEDVERAFKTESAVA